MPSIMYRGMVLSSTASKSLQKSSDPGEFSLYDTLSKNTVTPFDRTSQKESAKKRFEKFEVNNDKRQETRRSNYNGLLNKLRNMKTVSGDDFLVVMYDADHECYYSAATDLIRFEKHAALLRPDDADQSLQSSVNDASDDPPLPQVELPTTSNGDIDLTRLNELNSTIMKQLNSTPSLLKENLPPLPGIDDDLSILLSSLSPTKSSNPDSRQKSAITDRSEDLCRICGDSSGNKNEWIGCEYADGHLSNKDGCNYWVHVTCKGFADSNTSDFAHIQFYCPTHNPKDNSGVKRCKIRVGPRTRGGRSRK